MLPRVKVGERDHGERSISAKVAKSARSSVIGGQFDCWFCQCEISPVEPALQFKSRFSNHDDKLTLLAGFCDAVTHLACWTGVDSFV